MQRCDVLAASAGLDRSRRLARLHEVLLAELRAASLLDTDDAAVDGSHVRALKEGLTPDLHRSTARVRAASTM